jgi:hypothetical protein
MARFFIWLLAVAALVGATGGASFGAGRAYEARQVPPAPTGPTSALSGSVRTPFAGSASGAIGAPNTGPGRATVGVVSKIEGQMLTITTVDNQSVSVSVPTDAPITHQTAITLSEVAVGVRVSVTPQGNAQAGGQLVAQSIAVVPDGQTGGRGGAQGAPGGGANRGTGGAASTPTPASR